MSALRVRLKIAERVPFIYERIGPQRDKVKRRDERIETHQRARAADEQGIYQRIVAREVGPGGDGAGFDTSENRSVIAGRPDVDRAGIFPAGIYHPNVIITR